MVPQSAAGQQTGLVSELWPSLQDGKDQDVFPEEVGSF